MKQMRVLEGQVVTLVTIPKYLPTLSLPSIGEYQNPYVLETTPCEKINGHYFNLKTGREVKRTENMLEWLNLSGTVFHYKNSHNFSDEHLLLSRRLFENRKLVLFSVEKDEITPMMILRHVRKRQKDN